MDSAKSNKPVILLDQILLPFTFTPKVTISGGVNGKNYYFPQGEKATLTPGEYEAIMNSQYREELFA